MSNESTPERFAIGISFGNSSSSIARLTPVCTCGLRTESSSKLGYDDFKGWSLTGIE